VKSLCLGVTYHLPPVHIGAGGLTLGLDVLLSRCPVGRFWSLPETRRPGEAEIPPIPGGFLVGLGRFELPTS